MIKKDSKGILKAKSLSFSYDKSLVLEGATFEIERGKFVGVIGPNGGGKTTLLRLMMGLLKPTKGTLTSKAKAVGYVPQAHQFDPQFPISTRDVVLMGILKRLKWHGGFAKEDLKRAHEALNQVGLAQFSNRSFAELSGGQKQRALFARALVGNPEILFLDESFAFCDAPTKKVLQEELVRLNKDQGTTICMVTHDIGQWDGIVDRILCVQQTVSSLGADAICKHFAFGLCHAPENTSKSNQEKESK